MESKEKITFINKDILCKGRFLSLIRRNYINEKDNKKREIHWEAVEYNLALERDRIFGVTVIPIKYENPKKIIIIGNFRYPVNKYVLEFPSGLIEQGKDAKDDKESFFEIAKEAGKRELKEETGYTGEFKSYMQIKEYKGDQPISANVYHAPWISRGGGK